jgi:hypothetical protein
VNVKGIVQDLKMAEDLYAQGRPGDALTIIDRILQLRLPRLKARDSRAPCRLKPTKIGALPRAPEAPAVLAENAVPVGAVDVAADHGYAARR